MPRHPFHEKLRLQMQVHDIDQAELARRLDVPAGTVSRWVSGKRMPGGVELAAIARLLEIEAWKLLGSDHKEPLAPEEKPRRGRPPVKLPPGAVTDALTRRLGTKANVEPPLPAPPAPRTDAKKSD